MLPIKNLKLLIFIPILMLFSIIHVEGQFSSQGIFFITHSGSSLKFQKKKDLLFSFGIFGPNKFGTINQFQAQLGYSPRKHFCISIFHNRYNKLVKAYWDEKHSITGINLGSYFTIKYQMKRLKKRLPLSGTKYHRILFKFSSGYANGHLENDYIGYYNSWSRIEIGSAEVNLNLQKFYLQGDIHLLFKDRVHLSGIYRLGKVNYYKGFIQGQDFRKTEDDIRYILNHRLITFKEISVKAEVRRKAIGIYIQVTESEVMGLSQSRTTVASDLGLSIDIVSLHSSFINRKNKPKVEKKKS